MTEHDREIEPAPQQQPRRGWVGYFIRVKDLPGYRQARMVVILITGSAVLLTGVVMFVTPGPAIVVIPLGLAILATEFLWARRLLQRMKRHVRDAGAFVRRAGRGRASTEQAQSVQADETEESEEAGRDTDARNPGV